MPWGLCGRSSSVRQTKRSTAASVGGRVESRSAVNDDHQSAVNDDHSTVSEEDPTTTADGRLNWESGLPNGSDGRSDGEKEKPTAGPVVYWRFCEPEDRRIVSQQTEREIHYQTKNWASNGLTRFSFVVIRCLADGASPDTTQAMEAVSRSRWSLEDHHCPCESENDWGERGLPNGCLSFGVQAGPTPYSLIAQTWGVIAPPDQTLFRPWTAEMWIKLLSPDAPTRSGQVGLASNLDAQPSSPGFLPRAPVSWDLLRLAFVTFGGPCFSLHLRVLTTADHPQSGVLKICLQKSTALESLGVGIEFEGQELPLLSACIDQWVFISLVVPPDSNSPPILYLRHQEKWFELHPLSSSTQQKSAAGVFAVENDRVTLNRMEVGSATSRNFQATEIRLFSYSRDKETVMSQANQLLSDGLTSQSHLLRQIQIRLVDGPHASPSSLALPSPFAPPSLALPPPLAPPPSSLNPLPPPTNELVSCTPDERIFSPRGKRRRWAPTDPISSDTQRQDSSALEQKSEPLNVEASTTSRQHLDLTGSTVLSRSLDTLDAESHMTPSAQPIAQPTAQATAQATGQATGREGADREGAQREGAEREAAVREEEVEVLMSGPLYLRPLKEQENQSGQQEQQQQQQLEQQQREQEQLEQQQREQQKQQQQREQQKQLQQREQQKQLQQREQQKQQQELESGHLVRAERGEAEKEIAIVNFNLYRKQAESLYASRFLSEVGMEMLLSPDTFPSPVIMPSTAHIDWRDPIALLLGLNSYLRQLQDAVVNCQFLEALRLNHFALRLCASVLLHDLRLVPIPRVISLAERQTLGQNGQTSSYGKMTITHGDARSSDSVDRIILSNWKDPICYTLLDPKIHLLPFHSSYVTRLRRDSHLTFLVSHPLWARQYPKFEDLLQAHLAAFSRCVVILRLCLASLWILYDIEILLESGTPKIGRREDNIDGDEGQDDQNQSIQKESDQEEPRGRKRRKNRRTLFSSHEVDKESSTSAPHRFDGHFIWGGGGWDSPQGLQEYRGRDLDAGQSIALEYLWCDLIAIFMLIYSVGLPYGLPSGFEAGLVHVPKRFDGCRGSHVDRIPLSGDAPLSDAFEGQTQSVLDGDDHAENGHDDREWDPCSHMIDFCFLSGCRIKRRDANLTLCPICCSRFLKSELETNRRTPRTTSPRSSLDSPSVKERRCPYCVIGVLRTEPQHNSHNTVHGSPYRQTLFDRIPTTSRCIPHYLAT